MTPYNLLYLAPADLFGLHATVTGSVINDTYDVNWLMDGLPQRPLRAGTTTPSWSVTSGAKPVNFVTMISGGLDAGGTWNVGGGITTSFVQPYAGRVPLNGWAFASSGLATTSVTNLTVGGTGSADVSVGQFVAGRIRELERPIEPGGERGYKRFNIQPDDSQLGQVRIRPRDIAARTFSGHTTASPAGMQAILDWYDSTNDGENFSVIVPNSLLNDAWCVVFDGEPKYKRNGQFWYDLTLSFKEIPRKRWRA